MSKITIKLKGGPGSGHWGHAGRKGQRGGSVPGAGIGENLAGYLRARRQGMEASVKKELNDELKAKIPDYEDHEYEMLADVMFLDKERFVYYSEKYGLDFTEADIDRMMTDQKAIDKAMMRERIRVQDDNTYISPGGTRADVMAAMGDDLWNAAKSDRVGTDSMEARVVLGDEYGISIRVQSGDWTEDNVHEQLSWLHNLGQADERIGWVMRNNLDSVVFRETLPGREGCAMNVARGTIFVNRGSGIEWHNPTMFVHELGHVFDDGNRAAFGKQILSSYGRGRHVSSYAWINPTEDFAESFVAAIGENRDAYMKYVPDKITMVDDMLAEAMG